MVLVQGSSPMNQTHEPETVSLEPQVLTMSMRGRRASLLVAIVGAAAVAYGGFRYWTSPRPSSPSPTPAKLTISYTDAQPIVAAMRRELPSSLAGKGDAD